MRIQRPTFLLKLTLRSENSNLQVNAYGSNFELLKTHHETDDKLHKVEVLTHLPNKVMLNFLGINSNGVELVTVSLVGIPINREVLNKVVEYKETDSLQELENAPSSRSLKWLKDGCAIFDFFHSDPFAYHLYVGNKIKML